MKSKDFEFLMKKYGLELRGRYIPNYRPASDILPIGIYLTKTGAYNTDSIEAHIKVVCFLENNPKVAKRYKNNQSGDIKYFDVLRMAERDDEVEL